MFGIDDMIGSLVGGAIKMFSNKQENEYAQENAAQQQVWNQQAQAQSQAFNAQQAQLGREFAAGQQSKAEDFNSVQAALNRSFQETMSSSAYQRSVADMRAAGINPMVAAFKGGASTPGGDSGSISPASSGTASSSALPGARTDARASLLSGVISSAGEAARLKPTLDNLKSQNALTNAAEARERTTADVNRATERLVREQTKTEAEKAANVREDTRQKSDSRYEIGVPFGGHFNPVAYGKAFMNWYDGLGADVTSNSANALKLNVNPAKGGY